MQVYGIMTPCRHVISTCTTTEQLSIDLIPGIHQGPPGKTWCLYQKFLSLSGTWIVPDELSTVYNNEAYNNNYR